MKNSTMVNVRLDADLKGRGCAVLDKNGVSVTQLVRRAFEYLDQNQRLPEELFSQQGDETAARRQQLRAAVGSFPVADDFDFDGARQAYRESLAAKTCGGVRA